VLGGAGGLIISAFGASVLINLVTTSTRRLPIAFTLDSRVLLFTAGVSLMAILVFGLFPALQANRTPLAHAAQSVTRTPSRLAGGRLLIGSQMALSLFLLIAAGLFIRSLDNLRHLDTGFNRESVLIVMMDPRAAYGKDPAKYLALYRDLPERLEQLPGVRSASFADASFFGGNVSRGNIAYDGYAQEVPETEYPFKLRISPGFPETFGLSLVAGRTFTDRDDRSAPRVAIVSESIAKRYYPGQDAVAKRFCFSDTFHTACAIEIVGVVKDVRYNSLRQASPFTVYRPVEQEPRVRGDLQVRTLTDPRVMTVQVQDAIRRFNPELRVVHTTTLERLVDDSIVEDRLLSTLSTGFAVLAVALAAVGLYGITSYGVHRRTNEIGVRMALGASMGDVQWMVLREVLLLVTAGAVVGIPAALAASGVVRSLLFGLTPTDPVTVLAATVMLIFVAVLAGYIPARRATRIDPMAALRVD
jgi:predicted permease